MTDERPPVPPADLVQRVVPPFPAERVDEALAAFDSGAERSVHCLEHGLAAIGRDLREFERLLDFGCGPGRIMRWLWPLADDVELHGADIDADAIEWASAHIPYARFVVTPHEGPLPYPDGNFDLVVNHSVFTHIDERLQDVWLAELRRVTRPGGILLLSVHSNPQFVAMLEGYAGMDEDPEPLRKRLEIDGILYIAEDHYIGSTHPPFYHSTFHAPWYVFEHWHDFFEVRAYIPVGADTQDLVVLERRAEGAPVSRPIGHREVAAAHAPAPAASDALAHAEALHSGWPEPRTPLGRLKRRLLRGEIDRYDRLTRALIDAQHQARRGRGDRAIHLLQVALYQQGGRISLVERDLHREIDELRARIER